MNVEIGQAKLMKPLFVDGNYNREGKRIRAKYIKTISCENAEYPLWIEDGKPNKDYTSNINDQYYFYIQEGEWLVMSSYTEYELELRSTYDYLNREWYGNFEGRCKYFDELRKVKPYEESERLVKAKIAEEEKFCAEHCKDATIQAILLKENIDKSISKYIEARDHNGKFADFIGALFLGELNNCIELSKKIQTARRQEEAVKSAEREERRKKEQEEQAALEQQAIVEAENVFVDGGIIKDVALIVKIADKYGINIPIRTRGWILNTLSECTISNSGSVSYRYWKSKRATGSQKVYDVLLDIRKAIQEVMVA